VFSRKFQKFSNIRILSYPGYAIYTTLTEFIWYWRRPIVRDWRRAKAKRRHIWRKTGKFITWTKTLFFQIFGLDGEIGPFLWGPVGSNGAITPFFLKIYFCKKKCQIIKVTVKIKKCRKSFQKVSINQASQSSRKSRRILFYLF